MCHLYLEFIYHVIGAQQPGKFTQRIWLLSRKEAGQKCIPNLAKLASLLLLHICIIMQEESVSMMTDEDESTKIFVWST